MIAPEEFPTIEFSGWKPIQSPYLEQPGWRAQIVVRRALPDPRLCAAVDVIVYNEDVERAGKSLREYLWLKLDVAILALRDAISKARS